MGGVANQGASLAHVFAAHGNLLGFTVVLLGGLALNLTPCVYPLIGVTIAYFGNEGGAPRRLVILALLYVLGIGLSFSAVGITAALTGALFGAALQNPYVLSAVAALLLVLAASSFGFFTLQPPQWMMRPAAVARRGYLGATLMGLSMGVVAAPCIGPIVLGLLLMVQQRGSALFGFALFFTLAVGMGLPYVALAMAAGRIRSLPRSGEWLAWVEQFFGFILIGLALYFLDPLTPNRLMTRLLPWYAVAVGIFLGWITPAGQPLRPFMIFRVALGIMAVATAIVLVITPPSPHSVLTFEHFDRTLLVKAKADHKPVLLDFSADWCVPCREMERTTFTDPAVVKQAKNFVRLRANLTADSPANAAVSKEFNVQGVPTTIVIDPAGNVRVHRVGYVGPDELLRFLSASG
jgi:thiol:disulfide interchange protein DsbD